MKIKRWFYKNSFEDFYVLYEDENYILVKNMNTNYYSFGVIHDFGSFYGFPINQSCLNKDECINMLNKFIEIDEEFNDYPFNKKNIEVWNKMIKILKGDK